MLLWNKGSVKIKENRVKEGGIIQKSQQNETTKDVVEETVENEENKATEKIPLVGDFCVAGFLMPHFWGICNGIKIAWLAFIPIVYPFLAFYFGAEGYRLAYENKKWNVSIEEFCAKQVSVGSLNIQASYIFLRFH